MKWLTIFLSNSQKSPNHKNYFYKRLEKLELNLNFTYNRERKEPGVEAEEIRTQLREILLKAKAELDVLETLSLGSNPSIEEKVLSNIFGTMDFSLASGLKGEVLTDKKGSEFSIHLNGLFTGEPATETDIHITIVIPLDFGEPSLGLFQGENEAAFYKGPVIWKFVETFIQSASIESKPY